jgi:PTH1 family peptidyl-tRNA hydrolase
MILIAGLGNPGPKFKNTRHNLGFMVLNKFSEENGFPDWEENRKINCLFTKKIITEKEIELIKPLTYMNNSGRAVKLAVKKHNIKSKDLVIVHDDIDLDLGKIKIVKNRGAAGHKGIQSLINELRTKDFIRIRIGIKNQRIENKKQKTEDFVLKKFTKEEEKILKGVIKKAVEAIEFFLKEGLEKTQSTYNLCARPST